MPDICDLILDDHEQFRRRFAELDELRAGQASAGELERVWQPLADLLEVHAAAEEALFYPPLLDRGARAVDETDDAIGDHNEIRDAVRRAEAAEVTGDDWWQAVLDARNANSDHMAEEERGALPDFRTHADQELRDDLGGRWERFQQEHAGTRGLDLSDKDVDRYIATNS